MKAAERGRAPWAFNIHQQSQESMYKSALHKETGENEVMALTMLQHLHEKVLKLDDFSRVAEIHGDPTCSAVLVPLTERLKQNVMCADDARLPVVSEEEAKVINAVAKAIKQVRDSVKSSIWNIQDEEARTKMKTKAVQTLLDMGDDGLHGRPTFNIWAEFLGLPTQTLGTRQTYREFIDMWKLLSLPFRNLISRIGFESFFAACKENDIKLLRGQQQQGQRSDFGDPPPCVGLDGAMETIRYIGGWLCHRVQQATEPRNSTSATQQAPGKLPRNPMHSPECKLLSQLFRDGHYKSEIRERQAVNPSDPFTHFVRYLLEQGARLCSPGALGRFQSQVFNRASWKLESSQELWLKFVELVMDLLNKREQSAGKQPVSAEDEVARSLQKILSTCTHLRLGIQVDEIQLSSCSELVHLRHMLGLMCNKFLSMYASRLLKDLDLRPKKAAKHEDAMRASISAACKPRQVAAGSSSEGQQPQDHGAQQPAPAGPQAAGPQAPVGLPADEGEQPEGETEHTTPGADITEEEDARDEELFQNLLDMSDEEVMSAGEETGLSRTDENGDCLGPEEVLMRLIAFFKLDRFLDVLK